jgi:hypothetical protein
VERSGSVERLDDLEKFGSFVRGELFIVNDAVHGQLAGERWQNKSVKNVAVQTADYQAMGCVEARSTW